MSIRMVWNYLHSPVGWLYSGLGISAAAKAVHEDLRWRVLVCHCGSWRHSRRLLGKKECLRVFFLTFHAFTGIAVCRSASLFLSLFFSFLFCTAETITHPQNRCHIRRRYSYFQPSRLSIAPWTCTSLPPIDLRNGSLLAWRDTCRGQRHKGGGGVRGVGGGGGEREKKTPEPKPKLSLTY